MKLVTIIKIEEEANFWGTEATISMQIDFANRIKNEIYYIRGIEYVLNQIDEKILCKDFNRKIDK